MSLTPELPEALVAMISEIELLIPGYYQIRVEFWGPQKKFRRASLVTRADSFGDQGGAELPPSKRLDKTMKTRAAHRCKFPLELISRDENYAKYTLSFGDSKLERAASKFVHKLVPAPELVAIYIQLLERTLYPMTTEIKVGNSITYVGLSRVIPRPPKKKKKGIPEIEELDVW